MPYKLINLLSLIVLFNVCLTETNAQITSSSQPLLVIKDTVSVEVLCKFNMWTEVYGKTSFTDKEIFHKQRVTGVRVEMKFQERTLEWKTMPYQNFLENNLINGLYTHIQKYVVTETRWLESIEGCYQLIPLDESD